MWTIPLFKVQGALTLKAARLRARKALDRALFMAGDNPDLTLAIRMAVCEAELGVTTMIGCDKNALSSPREYA